MPGTKPTPNRKLNPDLEILMWRYQQGDSEAAFELMNVLSRILYRQLATSISYEDARDLLQDVLLRIHKNRHTHRPGEPLLPWAFAICKHARVSYHRKQERSLFREVPLEAACEPVAPPSAKVELSHDLSKLVAGLPDSQRAVIVLLKVNGLSLEEVAAVTSSTIGAVKQKAHRAYARLRLLLTPPEAAGHVNCGGTSLSPVRHS